MPSLFCELVWWSSSPYINHFLQPDTIIPNLADPQSWNRYSYLTNRPINFNDPTGHCVQDDNGDCKGWKYSAGYITDNWKWRIKDKFGVNMSDKGGKKWDIKNLSLIYSSLSNINKALNGKLKSLVGGATFRMREYELDPATCPQLNCTYGGVTSGTTITFNTTGDDAIRQMNIYHEFGHLLDNSPGLVNAFSSALGARAYYDEDDTYLFGGTGVDVINRGRTLFSGSVSDPNYRTASAIQHRDNGPVEQWADMFANYVAGNIRPDTRGGQMMQNTVVLFLFRNGVYP